MADSSGPSSGTRRVYKKSVPPRLNPPFPHPRTTYNGMDQENSEVKEIFQDLRRMLRFMSWSEDEKQIVVSTLEVCKTAMDENIRSGKTPRPSMVDLFHRQFYYRVDAIRRDVLARQTGGSTMGLRGSTIQREGFGLIFDILFHFFGMDEPRPEGAAPAPPLLAETVVAEDRKSDVWCMEYFRLRYTQIINVLRSIESATYRVTTMEQVTQEVDESVMLERLMNTKPMDTIEAQKEIGQDVDVTQWSVPALPVTTSTSP